MDDWQPPLKYTQELVAPPKQYDMQEEGVAQEAAPSTNAKHTASHLLWPVAPENASAS